MDKLKPAEGIRQQGVFSGRWPLSRGHYGLAFIPDSRAEHLCPFSTLLCAMLSDATFMSRVLLLIHPNITKLVYY